MFEFFKKKKNPERDVKELLRENLSTINVDMFYSDDPIFSMTEEDKRLYLQHFQILAGDKMLQDRIKWMINKQARLLINDVKNQDKIAEIAGSMTINGIGLVKDEIEKLAAQYLKETTPVPVMSQEDIYKI